MGSRRYQGAYAVLPLAFYIRDLHVLSEEMSLVEMYRVQAEELSLDESN